MRGIEELSHVDPTRLANVVERSHGLTVELPRELARSRRHGHQFSLILLCARQAESSTAANLGGTIDRLALRLRLSDLLIHLSEHRLLIACPETDAAGAHVLLRDAVDLVAADGVQVRASSATFPSSAVTASELLRACEEALDFDMTAAADGPLQNVRQIYSQQGGRR